MKRILQLAVLITFLTLSFVHSDEVFAQNYQGGIHFLLAAPQGDFEKNVDRNGYGISGQIAYSPQVSPVMVGLEVAYLVYGDENRREPFSTTIPDVTVDVSTTNNILLSHLLLRLQSNAGFFRPYAECLVGLNYLFTRTEIQNRGRFDEEVASTTNFDDATFSYGGGAGVMLKVHESRKSRLLEVLIDFRFRYLSGGKAEYLKEGSIRRENGQVIYDVNKSTTDLATFQIGAVVRF